MPKKESLRRGLRMYWTRVQMTRKFIGVNMVPASKPLFQKNHYNIIHGSFHYIPKLSPRTRKGYIDLVYHLYGDQHLSNVPSIWL